MTPFFVVIPKVINDTNFISSNVTETDYAVWNSATAYTAGQRVILTTGIHKIYESITSNTNKNPVTSITDWVEVSPTNRWKMFDSSGGTITSNANSIVFSFSADKVTSMGFLDLTATTVQIIGTQGATEFYNQTFDIPDKAIVEDWYAYFTADPFRATELTVKDIPAVFGATSPQQNAGDLRTKGYEIVINWKDKFNLMGKPFNYGVSFVLGDATSEITRYDNPNKLLANHYKGEKIGSVLALAMQT